MIVHRLRDLLLGCKHEEPPGVGMQWGSSRDYQAEIYRLQGDSNRKQRLTYYQKALDINGCYKVKRSKRFAKCKVTFVITTEHGHRRSCRAAFRFSSEMAVSGAEVEAPGKCSLLKQLLRGTPSAMRQKTT